MGLAWTILTFLAIVAIGAALRATGLLGPDDAHVLNRVIIYVGLPAFVFRAVQGAALSWELVSVVVVAWLTFASTALLAWLITRALRMPGPLAGGFILTAALGNTGYIGYPATAALLGHHTVATAVFYDVVGTVLALVFVGLPIASHFGEHDTRLRGPLFEVLTFPAVIALIVGLLARAFAVPNVVSAGLDLLANLVAPLVMLSVGLSLRPGAVKRQLAALSLQSGVKLLFAPAVAFGLASLLIAHDVPARVAVLEASMPAMMLSVPVGGRFNLETDFIASAVFVSTALAAITVPLIQVVIAG